jgi:hypothetical protein
MGVTGDCSRRPGTGLGEAEVPGRVYLPGPALGMEPGPRGWVLATMGLRVQVEPKFRAHSRTFLIAAARIVRTGSWAIPASNMAYPTELQAR